MPPGRYAPLVGDERFRRLNGRFRRVVAVGAAMFLGWYFVYVALAAFARGFLSRPVAGNVNVALLLGVLQFVSTFLLAAGFATYARRRLDPLAEELRAAADGPPAASSERAFGSGAPPWAGGGAEAGPMCTPAAASSAPGGRGAAPSGPGAGPPGSLRPKGGAGPGAAGRAAPPGGRADAQVDAPPGDAPSSSTDGSAPPTSSGTPRPAPLAPRASDGRWDVRMGDVR